MDNIGANDGAVKGKGVIDDRHAVATTRVKGGAYRRTMVVSDNEMFLGGFAGERLQGRSPVQQMQMNQTYERIPHMSSYGIEIPYAPEEDRGQARRDAQDARIRGRMSRSAYLADIQQRFAEAMRETDTPLEELVTMMFDAPIRDLYDHRAFLNSQMRDAKRLGQALLKIVADASLSAYQEASDDEPF
jgi:hypothetical protein